MTEEYYGDIMTRISEILEKDLYKKELSKLDEMRLKGELNELIGMLPTNAQEDILNKIRLKNRYTYLINDSGIDDFTGTSEHIA